MPTEDFEAVERLYNIKKAKYEAEELDDHLCDVLYKEALNEVACSAIYNGGRKVCR